MVQGIAARLGSSAGMEMHTGPELGTTETYMMPGAGSNPQLTYLPHPEEINYMGKEAAQEYIFDQGLYYPAANYYGYYCTGFESPCEWDDHNRVFGVDGQDLHYSGTESLPYVYYTPSYGYAQSPYNPYNPYIPGAVVGLDGPYIGTQQYVTNPSYQPQVTSPAYVPVVVQPSIDVPNRGQDPSLLSTGASMASRHVNAGVKYTRSLASTNIGANIQSSASGNQASETSQSSQITVKSSEGPLGNGPPSKQSLSPGTVSIGRAAHANQQIRNSSVSAQETQHLSHGRASTVHNPLKVTVPSNDGYTQFGSNVRGWATVDKFRPRLQFNGILNNPTGGGDVLGEQNKGPRTSRSKSQWTSAIVDEAYPTKSGASKAEHAIIISADQYNRDDFPLNYPDAKFFVIKSYSEDDVHKSIKYNVWSSTPNGNKRLDSAYEDAQRISLGQPRPCPIFLFFSVNASGQFCGVAEMIGPVNFNKDMDFWQQDKWTGSFPVKWHIIKDVPNTSLRHIILENNENKPVTNSRDTQVIPFIPGINMLNIFKSSSLKTSILDDFTFYEERERIMQEEKAKLLGRSSDALQFLPAVIPVNRTGGTISQLPNVDEKQANDTVNDPSKAAEKQQCEASDQPPKADGKQPNGSVNQPAQDGKPSIGIIEHSVKSSEKPQNGAVQPTKPDREPLNVNVYNYPKADGELPICAVDQPAKADGKPLNDSVSQPPKTDKNPSKLKDPKSISNQPPKEPLNVDVYNYPKADGELPICAVDQPAKADGKPLNSSVSQPPKADKNPSKLKDPKSISNQPPKADKKDPKSIGNQPRKANRNDPKGVSDQSPKADKIDPKSTGDEPSKVDRNPSMRKDLKATGKEGPSDEQVTSKTDSMRLSNDKKYAKSDPTVEASGATSAMKIGSLAVDSEDGEASLSGDIVTESTPIDVVTVGSMRIKVKGLGESSSSIITVGTIPIEPGKLNKQEGALVGSCPHQK